MSARCDVAGSLRRSTPETEVFVVGDAVEVCSIAMAVRSVFKAAAYMFKKDDSLRETKKGSMRQYAWLDYHGGCWYLVTANARDPVRKWANRHTALSDLTAEGWVVDGPHGKQLTAKHDTDRHMYGYRLMRTVH